MLEWSEAQSPVALPLRVHPPVTDHTAEQNEYGETKGDEDCKDVVSGTVPVVLRDMDIHGGKSW